VCEYLDFSHYFNHSYHSLLLNFFLDSFHMYILLDNIGYFATWYVFLVLPVH